MRLAPIKIDDMLNLLAEYAIEQRDTNLVHEALERKIIQQALDLCGGNQCQTAIQLRVHRNTLRRKMEQLRIPSPRQRNV